MKNFKNYPNPVTLLVDPHPTQQDAGLFRQQQEVPNQTTRFEDNLPEKLEMVGDGGANISWTDA